MIWFLSYLSSAKFYDKNYSRCYGENKAKRESRVKWLYRYKQLAKFEPLLFESSQEKKAQARQQKKQPTNGSNNSNNKNDRGQQTEWENYCASLTKERVLDLGLEFANYTEYQRNRVRIETNRKKFRAHYCIGAKAVVALIKDLPSQDPKEFTLYDLFLMLSFAKDYNNVEIHAGNWRVCPDNVKKIIKCYFSSKIQLLKEKKIRVGKFKNETVFAFSVDGVHCRTKESRNNPTTQVHSHKIQRSWHCLRNWNCHLRGLCSLDQTSLCPFNA